MSLALPKRSECRNLGNFSTKLLRGDPTGITRLHGRPEVITLGRRAVRLYPIYHPAAALYTPRMLETLREDFGRLPELLAQGAPEQPAFDDVPELDETPQDAARERAAESGPAAVSSGPTADPATGAGAEQPDEPGQLGLF